MATSGKIGQKWLLRQVCDLRGKDASHLSHPLATRRVFVKPLPAKTKRPAEWLVFLFCVTTTKNVRTVLCYKNSPDFFVLRYTYPLVLTGVDSNRYLPGCQHHACNEAYVFFDFVSFGRIVLRIVSVRYRVFTLSYRLTIPHPIPLSLSANFCRILRFGCITER